MTRTVMILALACTVAACAREGSQPADTTSQAAAPATPAVPAEVEHAVAVKRGIDAAPAKADSILSAHGMTAAGFDSLMYRIAADSALRAAYAAASSR
jgi:hypothetical protein